MDKNKYSQNRMFGSNEFPSYEEILNAYSVEFSNYIQPKGNTIFGFWMQTIADLELLDLELQGLTKEYHINPTNRTVKLRGNNAYTFHNLYPYKGKFYPRVVRTLINAFKLNENSLLLDPFNGSGTTTHEASLMGIKSVGVDVTPMGVILSKLKNYLLFIDEKELNFKTEDLMEIFQKIENKKWKFPNPTIYYLMLIIYFDTLDAFARTSSYNKKGKIGLFIEKFNYIRDCFKKTMEIKKKHRLKFVKAHIIEGDVLELKKFKDMEEKFDAVITSPPYYFSIDYVGKDKIAYDYLRVDISKVESKYLGMKNNGPLRRSYGNIPVRVAMYYEDLRKSIENIFWSLRRKGKLAIIVGDSTVNSRKIPTTIMTKKFCEEIGFKFKKLIFNPLLGARNRAIRGESIIICEKP